MSVLDPKYLPGEVTAGIDDDDLEDLIHDFIVGCSGVPNELVRPAYQADPPPIPEDPRVTWVAFFVKQRTPDSDPWISPDGTVIARIEELQISMTFYGPGSGAASTRLQMGASVQQNRDQLLLAAVRYVSLSDPVTVSEKIKLLYRHRVDRTLVLRRVLQFSYAVPAMDGVGITLFSDQPADSRKLSISQT